MSRLRSLLAWSALLVLTPIVGLTFGYAVFHGYRVVTEPSPLQAGDFADVVAEVGAPVVLLSTSTCPWCAKARQWLDAQGVPYRDCVTDVDPFAGALFDRLDAQTVPKLMNATQIVTGFDPGLFERLVAEASDDALPRDAAAHPPRCDAPSRVVPR